MTVQLTNEVTWPFQSTLPAWGSDAAAITGLDIRDAFQSTLPAWGSDSHAACSRARWPRFNPRSPRGGATPSPPPVTLSVTTFQSTLPAWGSDRTVVDTHTQVFRFQSTLPAWGSDKALYIALAALVMFQSTLPAWGSDERFEWRVTDDRLVSIHAPRVGERLVSIL